MNFVFCLFLKHNCTCYRGKEIRGSRLVPTRSFEVNLDKISYLPSNNIEEKEPKFMS